MRKILTIAQREFSAMVATKAFLFTLVLMPIMLLGGIVVIPTLNKLGGKKERRIVVSDASGKWLAAIKKAAKERNDTMAGAFETGAESDDDDLRRSRMLGIEMLRFEASKSAELADEERLHLSAKIRDGELYAFVEIPADFGATESTEQASFVSQDAALSVARRWLESQLRSHVRVTRLTELGIDPEVVDQADAKVSLKPMSLYTEDDEGKATNKGGIDSIASMFLPFGIMMLMFMVIVMAAQPMLESGMEEKQHRIAELLLGCVSPAELLTGKLLGNVAGSFVIFAVYGLGGFIVVIHNGWEANLNWSQMPWLILFQVLGVLFFSSIFLTIGASVSELKEAQSLLMPVWLVLIAPMMIWFVAMRDPNGVVATAFSFFPPSAPLMMSLRLSSGQTMPMWHAPLAALFMLVATYAVILIAARIFRASLLKADSAASLRKILQRLRAAE